MMIFVLYCQRSLNQKYNFEKENKNHNVVSVAKKLDTDIFKDKIALLMRLISF